MKILYVGDLHGYARHFGVIDARAAQLGVEAIVQCGDNGIFWPRENKVQRYFQKRVRQGKYTIPWYCADGNHEDHNKLDAIWREQGQPDLVELFENVYHVRRGGFVDIGGIGHVFCGGARSTDRAMRESFQRQRGFAIWWQQEAPSPQDLRKFYDAIQEHKPEVIVTHDVPNCVQLYREGRKSDPTAQGFMRIATMSDHRPKRWYFGHHHILEEFTDVMDIDFYGCGLHGQAHVWDSEASEESETET